ncbi:MAG: hypothetical protein PUE64_03010 [Firmicutes bacterium]|nr:hypothetical protein [Bacillota bacterium]
MEKKRRASEGSPSAKPERTTGRTNRRAAEESAASFAYRGGGKPKKQGAARAAAPAGKSRQEAPKAPVKKSRCPYSGKCGGCTMIDVPYDDQIR